MSTPVKLNSSCPSCGYNGANLIKPYEKHPGLLKCGKCDGYRGRADEFRSSQGRTAT